MKILESENNRLKQELDRVMSDNSATTSSLSDQLEEWTQECNKMRAKVEEREAEIKRLNNLLDKNTSTLAATNRELEGNDFRNSVLYEFLSWCNFF